MKFIPLTKGYEAMVDDEDYDRVMEFKWQVIVRTDKLCYGTRSIYPGKINQRLHNFIMPPPKGFTIDHIDRNGLNCQHYNMRFATNSQQRINSLKPKRKIPYRGVFKNGIMFSVMLQFNKISYYGGSYYSMIDAAKAYDELAKKIHGEFAILNFPTEGGQNGQ